MGSFAAFWGDLSEFAVKFEEKFEFFVNKTLQDEFKEWRETLHLSSNHPFKWILNSFRNLFYLNFLVNQKYKNFTRMRHKPLEFMS